MSSFICSAKHFNSIERTLLELSGEYDFYIPYSLRDICKMFYNKHHYNTKQIKSELKPIIDTLREINVMCVMLQYKDHYQGTLDNEIQSELVDVKVKAESKELTKVGLFNALRCVNYQIEIEHLKELRPLSPEEENALKFLNDMTNALACQIVSRLPDDKTNKWCVD